MAATTPGKNRVNETIGVVLDEQFLAHAHYEATIAALRNIKCVLFGCVQKLYME